MNNKFDRLSKRLSESSPLKLNTTGQELVLKYRLLISELEKLLEPIINQFVENAKESSKTLAVQIVSNISAQKFGNEEFKLMARLDSFTSGGKTTIDPANVTFHQNDKILNYLEKTI